MNKELIVQQTADFMRQKLLGEGSGHDWFHVARVVNLAKTMNETEKADPFIVELGALLHDIADYKFYDGDTTVGPKAARKWLHSVGADENTIAAVAYIVEYTSYRGGTNTHQMKTSEGKIVQDADRLDAVGAIGIARTFAYSGATGRLMYDPAVLPQQYENFADYQAKVKNSHTINHFYEKLLLLKNRMNTDTGRRLAEKRHDYMEGFLQEFFAEWEGER